MRISTSWSHQLAVNAMLDQQSKVSQTQLKLSTGKSILTPSEDPAASVRLLDLDQETKQTEQYQNNIVMARQRLGLEETNIQSVVDTLARIKELTVQGLNDSNLQSDRVAIAKEIDELNLHLLGIANTQNANGEYIFAGYKTDVQPYTQGQAFASALFPDTPVYSYPYSGDQQQRNLQIGPARFVADGNYGEQVFGSSQVLPGATPTAETPANLFELVSKLSASLKDNAPQDVSLTELDVALDRVLAVETTIGARMNALDRQESINDDYILDMNSAASDLGDLDYAEAISKFNIQNTVLQAAQQAFSRVQNLSLFNYL